MIEKLLRRFVSDETEFVLKAMEQIGADPELDWMSRRRQCEAYEDMYKSALNSGSRFPGYLVLVEVHARLEKERRRQRAAASAQKTAALILMGETFEEEKGKVIIGHSSQQAGTMHPLLQAAVQQQMNPQGVMQNTLGSLANGAVGLASGIRPFP